MIRARSDSLIEPQRAISSSVRPQPEQSPVAGAIAHVLTQGDSIGLSPS
jgi:hypothetical protein